MDKEQRIFTVGDINSDEVGTGARANGGKPRMDLLPLGQMRALVKAHMEAVGIDPCRQWNRTVLRLWTWLGFIQTAECAQKFDYLQIASLDAASLTAPERDASTPESVLTEGIRATCAVWEYGAEKYAAWNWAKGMPASVPLACAARHLWKISVEREILDDESGLAHGAHILCNLQMLSHILLHHPDLNDLPNPEYFDERLRDKP